MLTGNANAFPDVCNSSCPCHCPFPSHCHCHCLSALVSALPCCMQHSFNLCKMLLFYCYAIPRHSASQTLPSALARFGLFSSRKLLLSSSHSAFIRPSCWPSLLIWYFCCFVSRIIKQNKRAFNMAHRMATL